MQVIKHDMIRIVYNSISVQDNQIFIRSFFGH
jgi:hypothetical protein